MSILAWIVFGFIVGLIARAIMPGPQPMGIIRTTLLGVAGSFVGGTVANFLFHRSDILIISRSGIIGSVLGALLLMIIAGLIRR